MTDHTLFLGSLIPGFPCMKKSHMKIDGIPSGCAISGLMSEEGRRINGSVIIRSIACMHDRSNGLGGGFAAYGIYPKRKHQYAFHMMFDNIEAKKYTGEISSYGINKRYLEMFGYKLELRTDTEAIAYLLDLLVRRHRIPMDLAIEALASPFWKE